MRAPIFPALVLVLACTLDTSRLEAVRDVIRASASAANRDP